MKREVMGHRTIVGQAREEEICGAKLLRIDTPATSENVTAATQFVGAASIYQLSVISEELARELIRAGYSLAPVTAFEFSAETRDAIDEIKRMKRIEAKPVGEDDIPFRGAAYNDEDEADDDEDDSDV
ncbi:MAG: hypothetical protein ACRDD1_08220 [Planctomycetia bacterium]